MLNIFEKLLNKKLGFNEVLLNLWLESLNKSIMSTLELTSFVSSLTSSGICFGFHAQWARMQTIWCKTPWWLEYKNNFKEGTNMKGWL